MPIKTMLADRIACIRKEALDKTEGGIIIPESFSKKDNHAKVVAVGPKCEHTKVGDTILLVRAGTEIEVDGVEYTMTRETGDNYIIL
jgi:chaperonin GroES